MSALVAMFGLGACGWGVAFTVMAFAHADEAYRQDGLSGVGTMLVLLLVGVALLAGGLKVLGFSFRISGSSGCACGGDGPRRDWHPTAGSVTYPCTRCGRR